MKNLVELSLNLENNNISNDGFVEIILLMDISIVFMSDTIISIVLKEMCVKLPKSCVNFIFLCKFDKKHT